MELGTWNEFILVKILADPTSKLDSRLIYKRDGSCKIQSEGDVNKYHFVCVCTELYAKFRIVTTQFQAAYLYRSSDINKTYQIFNRLVYYVKFQAPV